MLRPPPLSLRRFSVAKGDFLLTSLCAAPFVLYARIARRKRKDFHQQICCHFPIDRDPFLPRVTADTVVTDEVCAVGAGEYRESSFYSQRTLCNGPWSNEAEWHGEKKNWMKGKGKEEGGRISKVH